MHRIHLTSALGLTFTCALLAASCVQPQERRETTPSPAIQPQEDGDFGGDPDMSLGADPDTSLGGALSGSLGGETRVGAGDDSDATPSSSSEAPSQPEGHPDSVSCNKFEYGSECLQRCIDTHHLFNSCHATAKHPKNRNAGFGVLSGCSWTWTGVPKACSFYYPSNSEMCVLYSGGLQSDCEWSP
jgi:hypothetical protein